MCARLYFSLLGIRQARLWGFWLSYMYMYKQESDNRTSTHAKFTFFRDLHSIFHIVDLQIKIRAEQQINTSRLSNLVTFRGVQANTKHMQEREGLDNDNSGHTSNIRHNLNCGVYIMSRRSCPPPPPPPPPRQRNVWCPKWNFLHIPYIQWRITYKIGKYGVYNTKFCLEHQTLFAGGGGRHEHPGTRLLVYKAEC